MYSFVRKPFWFVCLVCYCVRIWSWQIMNDSFYVIWILYRDFREYLVIDKKKKSCFGKNEGNDVYFFGKDFF